ncbi:DUF418 domain-containing protein [Brevibacillus migulae]|uniref:DUF418 domain-containing protein n=1 Tax=Brevibacillus migulae TaxID=1644114 RepID=UPI00106EB0AA|nr:DUF418 domain-containing protein [Brevibacillus migulae]
MRAAPVTATERIVTLDILRGFALFGIFLVNMPTYLAPEFARQMYGLPERLAPLDEIVRLFFDMFVQTKFYTMFSFLFGLGFYIFMTRAEQRGMNVSRLFSRRLIGLLLFGLLHLIFLWYGDILHAYAIMGFLLLLFYKRSNAAVLGWAIGLTVCYAFLLGTQLLVPAPLLLEEQAIGQQKLAEALWVYQHAPYGQWLSYRWQEEVPYIVGNVPAMIVVLLPLFLVGLYTARRGILHEPAKHRKLLTRVMWMTLLASVPLLTFIGLLQMEVLSYGPYQDTIRQLFVTASGLTLCFFYIASLTLLAQKPAWQKRLRPLGSVGQMALTNYLMQTILSLLIIEAFDLYNRIGLAAGFLLCLFIFALQVLLSSWWLKRFRFGPFEWLWRTMTYGYVQPLKRE